MIWAAAYLLVGGLVLILVLADHVRVTCRNSASQVGRTNLVDPEPRTLRYRLLADVVVPCLAGLFVIIAWPVIGYLQIKELMASKEVTSSEPAKQGQAAVGSGDLLDGNTSQELWKPKEFAVDLRDLREELTIAQIEASERVVDPLGAVPDLPFGHLNPAWRAFVAELRPGDRVHAFSARWDSVWDGWVRLSGYAVLRGADVGPHFTSKQREEDSNT